ncbi:MAG: peptidoglycan DD-metalloendopeptidase family protein [Candidatus Riflebacteria bacterium]|nr:peptidoglycan DD-metalloendopeptidase family protein [Candidatus Riflebacteria bacterium]
MKNIFTRLRLVSILFALSVGGIALPLRLLSAPQKTTESLQNEIEAIDIQLKYLKIKVDDQKRKSQNIEKRIKDKKQEIKNLSSQIEQLNKNQNEASEQIKKLERDNAESRKQLKELLARFRNRLVQLHKIRQGTLVSSVLFAKDLNAFLNRYQMVKYLLESDKSIIEELKAKDEKIKRISAVLNEKNMALEASKEEMKEKQKKLAKEQSSLNAMLNSVLMEKKVFLQKEKTLSTSRKQLEKQIEEATKIVAKPEFEKELGITADSVAVSNDSRSAISVPAAPAKEQKVVSKQENNEVIADSAPEAAKVMGFIWPIAKELREQVIEKGEENSSAIFIKPAADAEIVASAKGKVLYKGFLSGLGDVVILGHKRGFSTVYARLDNVWVGLNEVVDKGTVIGKVDGGGINGMLHFEIRFGGKKMPPLQYLPQ